MIKVLEECQFSSSRSSKMDIDDFLLLLDRFNKAGIHFVDDAFFFNRSTYYMFASFHALQTNIWHKLVN